jgi:hypothetical protein
MRMHFKLFPLLLALGASTFTTAAQAQGDRDAPPIAQDRAVDITGGYRFVKVASHREAPLIAQDPAADITDTYAFRSWNDPDKVVFIMNVIPSQEPSAGPNYFFFDDKVLYAIHLDLDRDGLAEDLSFEVRFKTELRNALAGLGVRSPVANVGPITALNGAGSEGLGIRQSYTVTMVRKGRDGRPVRTRLKALDGEPLFAVPSRQGPRTMPNYEDLAQQGIRSLRHGVRVFAGQRDETFYIDLGAVFDTINLRPPAPVLSDAQDADDSQNLGGVDMFSGFNVNTIAIEVPKALITPKNGTHIGMYASTSRPRVTVLRGAKDRDDDDDDDKERSFVQVARMANPLVNELVIRFGRKDRWNATDPADEARFIADYRNPSLAAILNLLFNVPIPPTPRDDLVSVLLRYPGPQPGRLSELLRLDLSVAPRPPGNNCSPMTQCRLTVLAHDAAGAPIPDPAGWPNGRRPNDDVTDIALRVVSGVLLGTGNARLGDGVNFNVGAPGSGVTANGIATSFPFLPTPHDGRDRRHIDPGE